MNHADLNNNNNEDDVESTSSASDGSSGSISADEYDGLIDQRFVIRIYGREPHGPASTPAASGGTVEPKQRTHVGVICDGCRGSVTGTRYKCLQCPDFDLCRSCEFEDRHSHHSMVAVRAPELNVAILVKLEAGTEDTSDDFDYLFEGLVLRESRELWHEALKGTELLARKIKQRLIARMVPSVFATAPSSALLVCLNVLLRQRSSESRSALAAWAKDANFDAPEQSRKKMYTQAYHVHALFQQHSASFGSDNARANQMYHRLQGVFGESIRYAEWNCSYLEGTAALLAYGYLELAGVIAHNLCDTHSDHQPMDLGNKLLTRMAFYRPASGIIDEETAQENVWRVLGDGYLGASKLASALPLYLRAGYIGSYDKVLKELYKQPVLDEWNSTVDYLKMVKLSVNDENVSRALVTALANLHCQLSSEVD
ncbi:hypothetical protein BV898_15282 [Hypsibius exemplaris]|uniref:ZZ-type domain-containing protein n=1 Tax=Hypsibius exemplaris TaxID=2072580 RepID=A0A9X6NDL7_HYPEX|nr:hypothetical protein BV898_15282 [Hypsibius exemplaris]